MTKFSHVVLASLLLSSSSAFTPTTFSRTATSSRTASLASSLTNSDSYALKLNYEAGDADTEFARRFRPLMDVPVKTVGEAFAEFTRELGYTINPLYKNMVTDLVGTTHLTVVNARFRRDAVWCLGIVTALDLLLKNYPEPEIRDRIIVAFFNCIGMNVEDVRAEAAKVAEWAAGKSTEEITNALGGNGDSVVAEIAKGVQAEDFWCYSRYFGIGLVKMMDIVGVEMDKDAVYPVMENWMSVQLGKSHNTACADSDLFFRIKDKLTMMETMMKEIEIREKKRMAERLEAKAEAALRQAEKERKWQAEVDAEAAARGELVEV